MKVATLYSSANLSGDVQATLVGPVTFQLVSSPAEQLYVQLQSGQVTIQIPQYPLPAQVADIIPPANSAVNKWIMQSGDTTGVQISNTLPTRLSLSTSITSFILRASGTEYVTINFY